MPWKKLTHKHTHAHIHTYTYSQDFYFSPQSTLHCEALVLGLLCTGLSPSSLPFQQFPLIFPFSNKFTKQMASIRTHVLSSDSGAQLPRAGLTVLKPQASRVVLLSTVPVQRCTSLPGLASIHYAALPCSCRAGHRTAFRSFSLPSILRPTVITLDLPRWQRPSASQGHDVHRNVVPSAMYVPCSWTPGIRPGACM